MPESNSPDALLGLGAVFTLMFVMLGPLKVLGPFAHATHDADDATVRAIAVRTFVMALAAAVVGGFVGSALMRNWGISTSTMELAGGVIFLIVGLSAVLQQYHAHDADPVTAAGAPKASLMAMAMRMTFPIVITPYGIAVLIVLLAKSHEQQRTLGILGVLLAVMVLNLLAMLFARRIMAGVTLMILQVLGAVLGVLQVGLAVEMIFGGLRAAGVLH